MIATLAETPGVDWAMRVQRREGQALETLPTEQPVCAPNGFWFDYGILALTSRNGDRLRWGFMTNLAAEMALSGSTHDRFNYDWTWRRERVRAPPNQSGPSKPGKTF